MQNPEIDPKLLKFINLLISPYLPFKGIPYCAYYSEPKACCGRNADLQPLGLSSCRLLRLSGLPGLPRTLDCHELPAAPGAQIPVAGLLTAMIQALAVETAAVQRAAAWTVAVREIGENVPFRI